MNSIMRLAAVLTLLVTIGACNKQEDLFDNIKYFRQEDRMGRTGASLFYIDEAQRNNFNTTLTVSMRATFSERVKSKVLRLNPDYNTNALGMDVNEFSDLISTDVLTVNTTKTSSFANLNGRTLNDDAIDVQLNWIYGGTDGNQNPGKTSDHVDQNDKAFSNEFPYVARPW